MSIYDYAYTSIENKPVNLSEYRGKVLLIVNTASKCGFTPQYEGLEALYKKYQDRGLVVLGFPCNQFLDQEPGDGDEISHFCKVRFGVTFPLSQKIEVRGENADPLYCYLTSQQGFEGMGDSEKARELEPFFRSIYHETYDDDQIKWNFTKFLIDRDGNVVARYEPPVEPAAIDGDIQKLL